MRHLLFIGFFLLGLSCLTVLAGEESKSPATNTEAKASKPVALNFTPNGPMADFDVSSPNGRVRMTVHVGCLMDCELFVDNRRLIGTAQMGLELQGQEPLNFWGKVLLSQEHRTVDESWEPVTGKAKEVRNQANELTLHLQEVLEHSARRLDLVVRAYDDGVAYRYVLPRQKSMRNAVITGESTEFVLLGNDDCWYADYERFDSSQEKTFVHAKLAEITPIALIGIPLLVKTSDGCYLALSEADVAHWAGSRFVTSGTVPMGNSGKTVSIWGLKLAVENDKQPPVKVTLPAQSPWRVMMIGKTPGDLIESNLIENLNPPSEIKDTSWIKPGIAS